MEKFSVLTQRGIHSLTIPGEGFNIHLFLDTNLLAQEIADITKRTEKKNNAMELKKEREIARRGKAALPMKSWNHWNPSRSGKLMRTKRKWGQSH